MEAKQVEVENKIENVSKMQFDKLFDFDKETGMISRKSFKPLNSFDNWRKMNGIKNLKLFDKL